METGKYHQAENNPQHSRKPYRTAPERKVRADAGNGQKRLLLLYLQRYRQWNNVHLVPRQQQILFFFKFEVSGENRSAYMCCRSFGDSIKVFCRQRRKYASAGVPVGTLAVNILGAFIAGFCYILCKNKFTGFEEYFPVLFMGFLGAFTTFSSFALESVVFFDQAQYAKFFLNIFLQNFSGISAAAVGFYLAKKLCF